MDLRLIGMTMIRNLISLYSVYWQITRRVLRDEKECLRDTSVKLGGRKSYRYLQWIRSCGRVHFVPVSGVYGAALPLSFVVLFQSSLLNLCVERANRRYRLSISLHLAHVHSICGNISDCRPATAYTTLATRDRPQYFPSCRRSLRGTSD